MPSIRIKKDLNNLPYFLTFTVIHWYYIFDRHHRWEMLYDSLLYCQKHKNPKIYAWVFMINHIHLIAQNENMIGFRRGFKKFTSYQIIENIQATEPSVSKLFVDNNGTSSLWQKTNMPKSIDTVDFMKQEIEYIENNPVRRGYTQKPEHWRWSSAFYRKTWGGSRENF